MSLCETGVSCEADWCVIETETGVSSCETGVSCETDVSSCETGVSLCEMGVSSCERETGVLSWWDGKPSALRTACVTVECPPHVAHSQQHVNCKHPLQSNWLMSKSTAHKASSPMAEKSPNNTVGKCHGKNKGPEN